MIVAPSQPDSAGFNRIGETGSKPLWQAANCLPEPKAPTGIEPV
jgi:hypothetical protein